MPIRPELRHFYTGAKWRETRERIRARAGDRCEQYKAKNHELILRAGDLWAYFYCFAEFNPQPGGMDSFEWHDFKGNLLDLPADERPTFAQSRLTSVQCGVAHLDHDPANNADSNLKFLCRRCHLIHDQSKHKDTRSTRKDSARPLLVEARA
jgi:hypothetical protein